MGLDLIRFAAALLVMVFHLAFASWAHEHGSPRAIVGNAAAFPSLVPFSWFGWVGVEIFFVLSGIVICMSATGTAAFAFARNRIVRLYPGAWLCGTLTLLLLVLLGQADLINRYVRTLLLFPSGPWVVGVYWTLGHEMAFYALIFLLLLAGKLRYLDQLLAVLGVLSAAFWLLLLIDKSWSLGPTVHALLLSGLTTPARLILWFGCFFALGGLLYLCAQRGFSCRRLAMIAICFGGSALRILWRSEQESLASGMRLDAFLPVATWGVAVLLMVAALIWNEQIKNVLHRHSRAIRTTGLATYPLYLLHVPFGAAIVLGLSRIGVWPGPALAVAIVAVIALSYAVTLLVEPPLQAALRRVLTASGSGLAARVAQLRDRRV